MEDGSLRLIQHLPWEDNPFLNPRQKNTIQIPNPTFIDKLNFNFNHMYLYLKYSVFKTPTLIIYFYVKYLSINVILINISLKDKYLEQEDLPFITVTLATVELVAPSESVTVNLQCKNQTRINSIIIKSSDITHKSIPESKSEISLKNLNQSKYLFGMNLGILR